MLRQVHNALERIAVAAVRTALDARITIDVNATTLHRSGEWFEVRAGR